ncbi:hypothetical protein L6164_018812 [Bauhinia variegata]|uniref:Uncharacterized protein n=1 Tax=Bauhinia variegata TaxID=167791 RepID=A0ACB9NCB8_BAUVA|nr:hypothetical protein L6164_018812 [Bauhinia variegata]
MCYVGKATKIFIFIVTVLVVLGLVLGFGLIRRTHHRKNDCSDGHCSIPPPATYFPSPTFSSLSPPQPGQNPSPDTPATPNPGSTQPSPPAQDPSPPNPILGPPPPITNPSPPPPSPDLNQPPPPLLASPPPPSSPENTTPPNSSGASPPMSPPASSTPASPGPVHA